MSWDIFVLDLPADAETIEAIPSDFVPRPLGPRAEIIAAIRTVVPDADFTDPTWGQIVTPAFVIEVSLGENELVDSIAFHVRGGEEAVASIAAMLDVLGFRAFDAQVGDIFNPEAALASFRSWRSFRDRALDSER